MLMKTPCRAEAPRQLVLRGWRERKTQSLAARFPNHLIVARQICVLDGEITGQSHDGRKASTVAKTSGNIVTFYTGLALYKLRLGHCTNRRWSL